MRIKWPETGSILCVGSDVLSFAKEHARKILCGSESRSAALLDSNSHPDFQLIQPETGSTWIKIDQIRDLIEWAMGKPQISDKKIAILSPAHSMNLAASNALLKTLEEPSLETLMILVTDKPSFVPATIRSRCHWIRWRSSADPVSPSDFQIKMQQDLTLLQLKEIDPVSIGMEWIKEDPKTVIDNWLKILHHQVIYFETEQSLYPQKAFWTFVDQVIQAKAALSEPNVPNTQLLFESLLIDYSLNQRPTT